MQAEIPVCLTQVYWREFLPTYLTALPLPLPGTQQSRRAAAGHAKLGFKLDRARATHLDPTDPDGKLIFRTSDSAAR